MANLQVIKAKARSKRKLRVKKKLLATAQRPRLVVFRSLKHIYVQLVDHRSGRCITGASSLSKELAGLKASKTEKASKV
ncbi:MAG: hypothetical protein B6D58_07375, partial [candidate division Zixibacteria bacterium 4484_95]